MAGIEELKIEVFGRVQGIGFRHFVKEKADTLGLKGYVMNKNDGSALIVAQGEKRNLDRLLKIVQRGPPLSKVEGISYFLRNADRTYDNFIIALDKGMISDQKSSFVNLGKKLFNIKGSVPRHVAIIPDGNRRWAVGNGMKPSEGHKKAIEIDNVTGLFKEAKKLGIKYMTLWFFSTENWKREKKEVDFLFRLFREFSNKFMDYAIKNKIRLRHLGRKDRLPSSVMQKLLEIEKATEKFDEFFVQICIDYGGRDEIARAINKILKAGIQEIKEEDISSYLDSAGIPDPDLIIRTSGENRTSGFMSFQSAYSEFYFTDVHFPEFNAGELRKAIEEFARRRRRFGK